MEQLIMQLRNYSKDLKIFRICSGASMLKLPKVESCQLVESVWGNSSGGSVGPDKTLSILYMYIRNTSSTLRSSFRLHNSSSIFIIISVVLKT